VKFLVTGATGFLGSRHTTLLRERGHEVVAVTRPHGRPRAGSDALAAVEIEGYATSWAKGLGLIE
jgi:uncharacterized protein YbjT (DUF2867 family)